MKIALRVVISLIAVVPCLVAAQSQQNPRPVTNVGTLKGQVGAEQKSGGILPAQSATVYVIFASEMTGGSFTHPNDTNTAGGQYQYQLQKLVSSANKQVKALAKNGQADEIAKLYLTNVDAALAAMSEWVSKHPDRASQVHTLHPDAEGLWSIDDLAPGSYEIVVRGVVAGHDADWEASVDLGPSRTITLPLVRPRFNRV